MVNGFLQSIQKDFSEEDVIILFINEIRKQGSIYLEELNLSSKNNAEIMSQVSEMNFIIHLCDEGTLILDPDFFNGDYK